MNTVNKFSLVSAIGKKHGISGGLSAKKYFQREFEYEELTSKEKEKIIFLKLKIEELGRFKDFINNYPNDEYYFSSENKKLFFTTKKVENGNESVKLYISKNEKLVYPEIIKI